MRNRRYLESQPLGLDEIIIVNPGAAPVRLNPIASLRAPYHLGERRQLFLGGDGVIYALHDAEEPIRPGDLLLGEDGAFHRIEAAHLGDDLSDLE